MNTCFSLLESELTIVGNDALVVLQRTELQVLLRVDDGARQLLGKLDLLDRLGAAPHDALGTLLILPEARLARDLVDLVDLPFQLRDVKETPLAHRHAA